MRTYLDDEIGGLRDRERSLIKRLDELQLEYRELKEESIDETKWANRPGIFERLETLPNEIESTSNGLTTTQTQLATFEDLRKQVLAAQPPNIVADRGPEGGGQPAPFRVGTDEGEFVRNLSKVTKKALDPPSDVWGSSTGHQSPGQEFQIQAPIGDPVTAVLLGTAVAIGAAKGMNDAVKDYRAERDAAAQERDAAAHQALDQRQIEELKTLKSDLDLQREKSSEMAAELGLNEPGREQALREFQEHERSFAREQFQTVQETHDRQRDQLSENQRPNAELSGLRDKLDRSTSSRLPDRSTPPPPSSGGAPSKDQIPAPNDDVDHASYQYLDESKRDLDL